MKLRLTKPLLILVAFLVSLSIKVALDDTPNLEKIQDVQVAYFDNKYYMDVYLDAPLSCKTVERVLHIKPFPMKGDVSKDVVYFPTCREIDGGVRIIYVENVPA